MDRLEVGYVARAHGLRGELTLGVHDPGSTVYQDVEQIYVGGRAYVVREARPANKYTLVRLEGITSRDAAEALRGLAVEVERAALSMAEGEVLLADLVGLAVEHAGGAPCGRVAAIEVGPQDRLVVHDGAVERLIPLVPELVVDIDLEAQRIVVELPEGWPETPR